MPRTNNTPTDTKAPIALIAPIIILALLFIPPVISEESLEYNQQFIYLQNVGWAHIVAPYTKALAESSLFEQQNDEIELENLNGGGVLIKYKCPIMEMTISDLKKMKRFIYKILISGKMFTGFKHDRIRGLWEYVPILENELRIVEKGILFEHVGGPDVQYIKDILQLKS